MKLKKRDFSINTRLKMRQFEKNVSFIDLNLSFNSFNALKNEKRKVWKKIITLYDKRSIKTSSSMTIFEIFKIEKTLRIMQFDKHMNKLMLMFQQNEKISIVLTNNKILRNDASYLLIKKLDDIERAIALWMFKHEIKNFIFANWSELNKQIFKNTIWFLKVQNVHVFIFKCDINKEKNLRQLLKDCHQVMFTIYNMIHEILMSKMNRLFELLFILLYWFFKNRFVRKNKIKRLQRCHEI